MSCVVEFNKPLVRFNFIANKYKQKIWVDALLRYGSLDLRELAATLNIDKDTLREVYYGKYFLEAHEAEKIARLLLVLFSD